MSSRILICLICLSFSIFSSITMSDDYINQRPNSIKSKVGGNVSIQCSITENIDIRNISLLIRKKTTIFTLQIDNSRLSKTLEVSGTYDHFTWNLNQVKYSCPKEQSLASSTIACQDPTSMDSKIYLLNGTVKMASLSAENIADYRSRIQLSGTILDLTITMTDLRESDRDCYTCKGGAEQIGESTGAETCLNIENSHQRSTGSKIVVAVGVVIGTVLLW